ncbi:MAG: histidine kinase [Caldimonas sp.]
MTVRADDNWLQRRYFGWAEPHYRRMPPRTRAEVERIDRWLSSRRGAGVWLAAACAVVASSLGLSASGMSPLLAIGVSLGVWVSIPMAVLGAWLQPERFNGKKGVRFVVVIVLLLYLGAAVGFLSGRIARHGGLELATLWPAVRIAIADVAPLLALGALVLGASLELAAFARRRVLKVDLELATIVAERDAAACEAAEARLRLLHGQIRPHFIFNTLACLQHWVDSGDARAGPLLRSLTAFLRTTTAALDAPLATVASECEAARHYLDIMASRLGTRLRWRVEVAPDCAAVELPSGLVLTLVENAVEHGIEPVLAGGRVEVIVRRAGGEVLLCVSDDGAGLAAPAPPLHAATNAPVERGVGVANCRARLHHRYGDRASLDLSPGGAGRGTEARVRIEPGA